jgi:glycosyltransferase involved in cell wall biosynthesis
MRLLFLTNFYPPASRGGYEQWCQEIAEDLRSRGHEIVVLTSRSQAADQLPDEPEWIRRELHLEMPLVSLRNGIEFFTSRKRREAENLERLRQILHNEHPDAVVVWGMWNLPRSLPALAEDLLPGRVVYYMGDYWPTLPSQYVYYWQAPARNWATAIPKALLKLAAKPILAGEELPALHFAHVLFPTHFMCNDFKQRGLRLQETAIIYGAVDIKPYLTSGHTSGHTSTWQESTWTLLYAGRLTHEKGVHTAIEAVAKLVFGREMTNIHLTIAGGGDADYVADLRRLIQSEKLESYVTLVGPQSPDAMPELYSRSDMLLFTSLWDEPFGRVLVEAMAAGVIVLGTATGGARELLVDNENALLFPPGDADRLAARLLEVVDSPALRQRLIEGGRQTAIERFDSQRMADEIEAYLERMVVTL